MYILELDDAEGVLQVMADEKVQVCDLEHGMQLVQLDMRAVDEAES